MEQNTAIEENRNNTAELNAADEAKRPLIFSGTTEGRQMSERLSAAGIDHIVCVATGYGRMVMGDSAHADVRQGRLTEPEMETLISGEASVVFDATHPYAAAVTQNIWEASFKTGIPYVRIVRSESDRAGSGSIRLFPDAASCAEALAETQGNILLTTGSKELHVYAKDEEVRSRLYARVLPTVESITLCEAFGINGSRIIALQGPFSYETDLALIRQYDIKTLVTKSSGSAGGHDEKIRAAADAGIQVYEIGRPADENGISAAEALHEYFGLKPLIHVDLVGTGPGRAGLMTAEAAEAVRAAGIIFGAPRMIEPYADRITFPYYLAKDIIPVIEEERPERVAVLFSGDTGFYSGAAAIKPELETWLGDNGYEHSISIHPGISSYSYLAAAAGISYSDAAFCSMHGRADDEDNMKAIVETIRRSGQTFLLLSGAEDVRLLGSMLNENRLDSCTVVLGCQLSYDDEIIAALTPEKCSSVVKEGLYTALIVNREAASEGFAAQDAAADRGRADDQAGREAGRRLMPVIDDESFARGRVPMSKENIRHLSIMKLDLRDDSVVYDIGSGSGSVACEMAGLDEGVRVYAVEMKAEACTLIKQNAERFGLGNIGIINGTAPEALEELEAPTHAFIGGSSGNMKDIVDALRTKAAAAGRGIRVVINAVSLETIAEIENIIRTPGISDVSVEQISVSRSREAGSHHLMMAENPVMIAAFTLNGAEA